MSQSNPGVRFTLRKRSIRSNPEDVNISSYNSDFLSGLFSDVAKITEQNDSEGIAKRALEQSSSHDGNPSFRVSETPRKKRCTSLSRIMSRSRFSALNLADLEMSHSPKAINEFVGKGDSSCYGMDGHETGKASKKTLRDCSQHDSLSFQLDCVAGSDSSFPSSDTAAIIAFPNLPATVSDSSCAAGLTRVNLIRQASSFEKQPKESFGWFVDLDDLQTPEPQTGLPYSVSNDDLAFQAPTAPRGDRNDAEVQWAKAADTIDDVLGPFF
eukprot:scaffold9176_cov129-Cylindrotheca_fusiformis.AAC.5